MCPSRKQYSLSSLQTWGVQKCQANHTIPIEKDKHYGEEAYNLNSVEDIQADILKNGPIDSVSKN